MSGGVLVTGTGALCSLGEDVPALTAALRAGRDGFRPAAAPGGTDKEPDSAAPLPEFALAELLERHGAPERVRAAARIARRAPLPVRAALVAAVEAWTRAGMAQAPPPADRVALVVAGNNLTGAHVERERERSRGRLDHLSGRVALRMQDTDQVGVLSEVLGVHGEGHTVGAASASGNAALLAGARLLAAGDADVCLVVGPPAELSALERRAYQQLGALADPAAAPGEPPCCRPFDAAHRGFVDGQGAAAVVLETAGSARARGVPALARLAGGASGLAGNSLADPGLAAEERVMRAALDRAGIAAGDLAYVSAHGTGSPLGDRTEAAALRAVLGPAAGRVWVNATKALTGHCLASAGVLEAVATVAQMRGGFVHPQPRLTDPITADLRFTRGETAAAVIPFALSNGFGLGGIHTAVVLAAPGT
ncbi:beta-ketoacyl synthase N-terminal-like domain-containing protein [Streptomyces specialis]|uniref:beta-ketoacyl synthase N-terminal-like domain-containing protein n=1 Tax=Streptomyces specialis TaxID=498367 RepID=UPI00073EE66C|nr:beta-ketoacyl synthase N-terminal-like domain-containing protein [Streptomyces specialis]